MPKLPAFVSFAAEDARMRDLFIGQGRHPDTPWEIVDWSLHEAFDEKWKTQTRPRIARADVVILLVGLQTYRAEGAIWEVNYAKELGVPAFGVWISKSERGPVPPCLSSKNVIPWTWHGIGEMMRKAARIRPKSN